MQWKERLKKLIVEYYAWLKRQQLLSAALETQLHSNIQALRKDAITIAMMAEFSRGKSHLINAIFFSDQGRQFLPSSAGRTTMCPVEIMHDASLPEPCLQLLPIETLLEQESLGSFKQKPEAWTGLPLRLDDKLQMQEVLQEVKRTCQVSLEEARRMGLDWQDGNGEDAQPQARADIPKWRHALLNFPHPLMKQGLRIIDTPGLNALGGEPELLLNLLPGAQVIIFVLGADTGVTQSELRIWRDHIQVHQQQRRQRLLVVLNKIDTLWDELAQADEVSQAISQQQEDTARILGLPVEQVFPVSAYKAMVARFKQDDALLARSGLLPLERHLFHDLVAGRRTFFTETICQSLGQMINIQVQRVQARLKSMQKQRSELFRLSDKSSAMLGELSESLTLEKVQYMQRMDRVRAGQKRLEAKSLELAQVMDLGIINALIDDTEKKMQASWTTAGLKDAIEGLFDQLNTQIAMIDRKVDEVRDLLLGLYRWLEHKEGYSLMQPKGFSIIKYRAALDNLHQEADAFRKSTQLILWGKNRVIQRFLQVLAEQARRIFADASRDAQSKWIKLALEPVLYQMRDQKDMLNRKDLDLRKIGESKETLSQRIKELHCDTRQLHSELHSLQRLQAENAQLMAESQAD